ncbi:MAG TPA: aldo/keto reductase [Woeseiaceae bacterium]|nr:aldo/keto reductase [Woeseiaceae bacterium]
MKPTMTRRELVTTASALGLAPSLVLGQKTDSIMTKKIPSTGERLPVIGLGTYQVFDAESTPVEIESRRKIVELLTSSGGSLLDTSPMYNRSERIIGDVIASADNRDSLFLATKVWTNGKASGASQMQRSAKLMRTDVIDLMQVHNLRDTANHMESIRDMQAQGKIRYSGLTHYTASAHTALVEAMQKHKPDFIQINYSLGEREAEQQVLPAARDQGVAVLINRPYQAGRLFAAVRGQAIPDWASSIATSWGQFFLKFIISHPAVTCVIPATSKPQHMIDNIGAGMGDLPDASLRKRMAEFVMSL